jgi:hypothetical protein
MAWRRRSYQLDQLGLEAEGVEIFRGIALNALHQRVQVIKHADEASG